jgi:hypothetical protein
MSFPQSPLGIKVQMNLQGLGWTDIVRDDTSGYRVLMEDGITITRGHTAEQQRTTSASMNLTLLDPKGVFNNQNPRSPYYGVLPRNVPIRVFVQRPTVSLIVPFNGAGYFTTPSSAGLNTAGDLDVIIDVDVTRLRQNPAHILASKSAPNQQSWIIQIESNGFPAYLFSSDGVSFLKFTGNAQVPATGRFALRVFHDVANGANSTCLFQTAPTFSGTFTTLGTQQSTPGNFSIFAGTAPVEISSGNGGSSIFANTANGYSTLVGRCYYFKYLRNASQVALVDFTSLASGASTYVDANSNTWTLTAGPTGFSSEVGNADYRFYGEVSSLPQTWEPSGKVVKVALEAGGLIRRLSANSTPLSSPIYKNFINQSPTGYWPGEDGSNALAAGSAVTGSASATLTDITFTTDNTLPGTAGCMVMGGTSPTFIGIPKSTPIVAGVSQAQFVTYFKFPSIPLSGLTLFSLAVSGGTAARVDFIVTATQYSTIVYDVNDNVLTSASFGFGTNAQPTNWIALRIRLLPSGGNVNMLWDWYNVTGGATTFFTSGNWTYAGTVGRFSKLTIQGLTALSGVHIAHLLITQIDMQFISNAFVQYSNGYNGERASARWTRVLADAGVYGRVIGIDMDTEQMGPQPIDTLMNILYECQDVDGGEIVELRDQLGLAYRTRVNMMNQYGLGLNYGTGQSVKQLSGTLEPVPDDLDVANDITLSRRNGSSVRVTLDSGPMSTLDPTLGGIGRVTSAPEINNYSDLRLLALAQYALGLSTWIDARYPTVQISLHRISAFGFYDTAFTLAANTDIGDAFSITNLPIFLPPDTISLIARGMTEVLTQFTWDITYNATPGRPLQSNYLSSTASEQKRADSSNTILAAAISNNATSASFKTTTGALCVTTAANPAEFPFDVMLAGERVTVTAITGTTSPQAASITRSVNGIVKAQVINTPVILPADTAMYVDL